MTKILKVFQTSRFHIIYPSLSTIILGELNFDDKADDLSVSYKPNTLVLFNLVIDCSPEGIGERIGKHYSKLPIRLHK